MCGRWACGTASPKVLRQQRNYFSFVTKYFFLFIFAMDFSDDLFLMYSVALFFILFWNAFLSFVYRFVSLHCRLSVTRTTL